MVGTRTEKPSSLPLSSGSTRPTAAAAPVLVGIMLCAAARARRRSPEHVGQHLIVGVAVDGVHQAADDADLFVQHFHQRRQAVGGAARVRDDRVAGLEHVVIDTRQRWHQRLLPGAEMMTFSRHREVRAGLGLAGEQAGAFEAPRPTPRSPHGISAGCEWRTF